MFNNKQKFEKYGKILFSVYVILFIWILGFELNYLNFMGGKLYYFILIPIGSLNLLFSSIYLLKIKRRKISFEKFLKSDLFNIYKKKQICVLIVALSILLIIFTIPYFFVQGSLLLLDEENELQNVVFDLIGDSTNETEKINSILLWFNKDENAVENFSNIYYRFRTDEVLLFLYDAFFYFEEEPQICIRGGSNPYSIFISRSGRCSEYSYLFAEMGKIAGLNVSTVHCLAENHAWNEVYLQNNKTIIVDASAVKLPNSKGIMSIEFMQDQVARDWRGKGENPTEGNISFVYCKFPNNNTKYEITSRYTDTINLTINITDANGNPFENVTVKIISHNRPDWIESLGIVKTTNKSGQCTFKIGGGRYHFSFQRDGDWLPIETDVNCFWEDVENQYYNYKYVPFSILNYPMYLVVVFFAVLTIGYLSIRFYKFLPQKKK